MGVEFKRTGWLIITGGIGPQDQLEIVANSTTDGPVFISDDEWILLPVGHNLEDHTNVSFRLIKSLEDANVT